jgi:protein-tyrosine kinase
MKLQKAMAKAKKERQNLLGQKDPKEVRTKPAVKKPLEKSEPIVVTTPPKRVDSFIETSKPGGIWKPPVYNKSRYHQLDRETAIENRCVCLFPDSEEIEFYKILRTQIQQRTKAKGWNTVMVTSTQPGEGKTLTTINLAITMAKEFSQTVLVADADFRNQSVHRYLGVPSERGLINHLLGDQPLNELITWPDIKNFTFISGGRIIRESTELLGSPKMKSLVQEMKHRYPDRYVLFDVPPVLAIADATAFAPMVDCILVVVEAGRASYKDIKKALELLPREKILGFVLNRYKSSMKQYYKYY